MHSVLDDFLVLLLLLEVAVLVLVLDYVLELVFALFDLLLLVQGAQAVREGFLEVQDQGFPINI